MQEKFPLLKAGAIRMVVRGENQVQILALGDLAGTLPAACTPHQTWAALGQMCLGQEEGAEHAGGKFPVSCEPLSQVVALLP